MRTVVVVVFSWVLSSLECKHPPGHLHPLGSHQPPEGVIASTDVVPCAKDFFEQNALPGEPLLFKGAAKKMQAYSQWTDDYLSGEFGEEGIDVEEGKKENRSMATFHFKLQEFIRRYKDEDIYMVESLPLKMQGEYSLLKSLNCGGYTNVLQDAVVWFSSGGTKSVLHFDSVDNINCLFDGTKELLMINKGSLFHSFGPAAEKALSPYVFRDVFGMLMSLHEEERSERERSHFHQAHIDRLDGGFSSVDVDSVDMYKFPGLQTIPYYKVLMEAGDCLFIPARWIHQVRSYGTRNLAVNIWWAHLTIFNYTDCEESPYKDQELIPLNLFEFHPMETIRQGCLQALGGQPADLERWIELMQTEVALPGRPFSEETLKQNFQEVDANKDGYVTAEEVYDLNYIDIGRVLGGAMEEEEEEGEEEEEEDFNSLDPTMSEANMKLNEGSANSLDKEHLDTEHTEL